MAMTHEDTGVALWRRVADSLERGIADGRYLQGEKLPSETDIADSHRVNRHTVRRALAALAERGLVRAERGSGTFVEGKRLTYPLRSRTRFSEIVGAGGREASGQLIAANIEAANSDIAGHLRIKVGTALVRIESMRAADGTPLCVSTSFLPAARFEDAGAIYERKRSMTKTLAHYGIRDYRRAWTRLTAAIADAGDASRLKLAMGSPVLVVDSLDVDTDGRPLLTARTRFAAERVQFTVET
jgi:GntR family phosphonate transport system transcriptional regulator